jgi:hypothetical protein
MDTYGVAGYDDGHTSPYDPADAIHSVIVTALQSDHDPGTNHEAGRAMDIGAVDGEICRGVRTGACAQLVRELAAMDGRLRSTELIYCWDPTVRAICAGLRVPTTVITSTGEWTLDGRAVRAVRR